MLDCNKLYKAFNHANETLGIVIYYFTGYDKVTNHKFI